MAAGAFSYPDARYLNKPFPHAVVCGGWDQRLLLQAKREIGQITEWSGEKDFQGSRKKRFLSDPARLPPAVAQIVGEANSPRFVQWLEALTGERGLVADHDLTGGGVHSILPGGFLGMHTDFNFIESKGLYRRLNVLLYLNPGWRPEWGGQLQMRGDGAASVDPSINTMVVFTTDDESVHGHPAPLEAPQGITRDSIALYYYSRTKPAERFKGERTDTDYRPVRLNLGCGNRHIPGFVNVDLAGNWCKKPPDLAHDITQPLPYADGSVDEIHAYHVFEHFYRYDADAILDDWVRVLRPGGRLVLELPCLDKVLHILNVCAKTGREVPDNLTLWGLYGDPSYAEPAMVHRWCYSVGELSGMYMDRGLTCTEETPQTHQPVRDMRLVGVK